MWEKIQEWMQNYQKGQQEQYSGFHDALKQMPNYPQANAHENIDNLLVSDSLNRIKQASSGNWAEALYEAKTKGGKKRYIHKGESMLGSKENFGWLDDMVRMSIEQNPEYADTLAASEVPETIEGMLELSRPNAFQRLINKYFK
jgi:hypothetical protein